MYQAEKLEGTGLRYLAPFKRRDEMGDELNGSIDTFLERLLAFEKVKTYRVFGIELERAGHRCVRADQGALKEMEPE